MTQPETTPDTTPFLGLAPFLRASIAGQDLRPLAQEMLAQASVRPEDAPLWMNLALLMQCLGERALGLSLQAEALAGQRVYRRAGPKGGPVLLVLMHPGDIAANTPIDCLFESDAELTLVFHYLDPEAAEPLPAELPEHDAVLVALADAPERRALLARLAQALQGWPKPVLNAPEHIPVTARDTASALLHDAPGIVMPRTHAIDRATLFDLGEGQCALTSRFADCDFPVIVRPSDSQAGRDLAKIDTPADIFTYLAQVDAADFFLARFIDYRGADGLFRKFRLVLIDGEVFVAHMAVSADWMVHYVNAGMYEKAERRAEEARFMAEFPAFAARHAAALAAIHQRTGLDYLCIDAAETAEGKLLIFEIDHTMVVHAMDPETQFPYKPAAIARLRTAFLELLARRIGSA